MPIHNRQLESTPGALLTIDEVAQRMSVQPDEVEDMIRNHTLPSVEQAGEPMVHVAQVDYYTSSEISKTNHLGGSNEEINTLAAP